MMFKRLKLFQGPLKGGKTEQAQMMAVSKMMQVTVWSSGMNGFTPPLI